MTETPTDESAASRTTSRRTYLKATGGLAVAGVAGLAGCSGGGETGTLATRVTDQPGDIADFESCVVTLAGIWVGPEAVETDSTATATDDEEGRTYHEFDEPRTADLVELADDSTELVGEHDLETGEYAFLQLDVTGVDATLTDGSDAEVTTPGEAPLTFNASFEVRSGERTVFTADFTPVKRGAAGGYILQPVPQGITVSYESVETTTA